MSSDPNILLREACQSGDVARIRSVVHAHHTHISIRQIMNSFFDNMQAQKDALKAKEPIDPETLDEIDHILYELWRPDPETFIDEAALILFLREYRPFAAGDNINSMFLSLCGNNIPINLTRTFVDLYGCDLTEKIVTNGVLNWVDSKFRTTQIDIILPACIDKLTTSSYWLWLEICCNEQRADLLEQIINQYHYPIYEPVYGKKGPFEWGLDICCRCSNTEIIRLILNEYGSVCKRMLTVCADTLELDVLRMVLEEYSELLMPSDIIDGLNKACRVRDTDMIEIYANYMDRELGLYSDEYSVKVCGQTLDDAVRYGRLETVKILLTRFMHMLWFEDGHQSYLTGYMAWCVHQTNVDKYGSVINELLADTYGSRLTIGDTLWTIAPNAEPQ